jgi:hypothetical protein
MPPSQGRYDFAQPGGRVTVGQGALQSRAFEFSKPGIIGQFIGQPAIPALRTRGFKRPVVGL